jgi:hypothetical protein
MFSDQNTAPGARQPAPLARRRAWRSPARHRRAQAERRPPRQNVQPQHSGGGTPAAGRRPPRSGMLAGIAQRLPLAGAGAALPCWRCRAGMRRYRSRYASSASISARRQRPLPSAFCAQRTCSRRWRSRRHQNAKRRRREMALAAQRGAALVYAAPSPQRVRTAQRRYGERRTGRHAVPPPPAAFQ